jgi:hypothetical protein
MENVLGNLWVGGDADYEKIKERPGWSCLRCAKFGPGGHKETLGYTSNAAPKGPDYLAVKKGDRMALNFIDASDPNFIPLKMIETGLEYIDQRMSAGDKVLVACNAGHSRGPTTATLYLRAIGELPSNFISSERVFRTLYHKYDPGIGVRQFAKTHWGTFDDFLKGNNG